MLPLSRHIGKSFVLPLASKLSSLFSSMKSSQRRGSRGTDEMSLPVHEPHPDMVAYSPEPSATQEKIVPTVRSANTAVGEHGSYWAHAEAIENNDTVHEAMGSLPVRIDQTVNVTRGDA